MTTASVDTTQQLEHLDDADVYATAWNDVLSKFYASSSSSDESSSLRWGGRGQGGRGLARRTVQPKAVSIPNVRLEYFLNSKTLLNDTLLKLHSGHVYGVVGATGRGKSSLLRRLNAHKIPGFPPHLSTLYIHPHAIIQAAAAAAQDANIEETEMTPMQWILQTRRENVLRQKSHRNTDEQIDALQLKLDDAMDRDDGEAIEEISNQMASLDDGGGDDEECTEAMVLSAVERMGLGTTITTQPISSLTPGECQKVSLTIALLCRADIVLFDNPTYGLDVEGLLRLRDIIGELKHNKDGVMTLVTSNDCDLVNDLCTHTIEFTSHAKLQHYHGNFWDCSKVRDASARSQERQEATREKKAAVMSQTIDNLKRQAVPKRGGAKKKNRQVNSHKKRMERLLGSGREDNENQDAGRASSFRFEPCASQWNEPLVYAMDVASGIRRTDGGYLFDCVDMCIEEGSRYCILGENKSGKSTLLQLLAGLVDPGEGKVTHALGLEIGYLSQQHVLEASTKEATTPLQLLTQLFPLKTEQDIRGEMTRFGLRPKIQSEAPLEYLSDGERFRLRLAQVMLCRPQILFLDDPTAFLDIDSVNNLADALSHWNGTVVMVSHDTHFLRSIEPVHYSVIVAPQGKLFRLDGTVDEYLRSFDSF